MAHYKIKSLNYIASSKKQNIFNIDFVEDTSNFVDENIVDKQKIDNTVYNSTFFGEVAEINSMTKNGNCYTSMYTVFPESQTESSFIIHNLFDIRETKLQSYNKNKQGRVENSKDFIDVYAPDIFNDVNIIDMCQLGNYSFALTEKTTKDFATNRIVFRYPDLTQEYEYFLQISSDLIKTYLYPTPFQLSNNSFVGLSSYQPYIDDYYTQTSSYDVLSDIFDVATELLSVKYNYILDFQHNLYYNYYKNGTIFSNLIYCKNAYDSTYSMNVKEQDNRISIDNCRDYCGLGKFSNEYMYLKYRDNESYYEDSRIVKDDTILKGNPPINIKSISMNNVVEKKYDYQHVEVVKSINKLNNNSNHKSTLYSIELNNIGLNSNEWISDKMKTKIKQNIQNYIRNIVDTISPANTQLFNVYFTGV